MKKNILTLCFMFMIIFPIHPMHLSLNHSQNRASSYIGNTLFKGYYFAKYQINDTENEFKITIETDYRVGRGSLVFTKKCVEGNGICEISQIQVPQDLSEILPIIIDYLRTHFACTKCIIHLNPEQEALVHACIQAGFTIPDKEIDSDSILVYSPRRSSV